MGAWWSILGGSKCARRKGEQHAVFAIDASDLLTTYGPVVRSVVMTLADESGPRGQAGIRNFNSGVSGDFFGYLTSGLRRGL